MKHFLLSALSPIVALLIWELLSRNGIFDIRFFPPPSAILDYLFTTGWKTELSTDVGASLYRVGWGYSMGTLAGITLGTVLGLSRTLNAVIYPLVALTYPIPKIALLPLIMLVFGIGELSKILVVGIGVFFLVLMNTLHGVASIARIYHDVAYVYQIRLFPFITRVILPGALPSIFTGLKLALGYSLVIVVAAEFSAADAGIGYRIWQSWETFSIKAMYAAVFIIGALGVLFTYMLELLERWCIPWRQKQP